MLRGIQIIENDPHCIIVKTEPRHPSHGCRHPPLRLAGKKRFEAGVIYRHDFDCFLFDVFGLNLEAHLGEVSRDGLINGQWLCGGGAARPDQCPSAGRVFQFPKRAFSSLVASR